MGRACGMHWCKSKVVLVYTMKAYRKSGGRVPLVLKFGTRRT